MFKSSTSAKAAPGRLKALPWAIVLQAVMVVGKRWRALSENERARVASLLRRSGGRPGNLSARERKELRKLAGKLDLKGLARELGGLSRGRRGKRGR
jgi:hypothetical protein